MLFAKQNEAESSHFYAANPFPAIALCFFPYSGAPAARRAAKRSPIIIEKGTTRMHRNRNPCNSFLLVKMASGMDHGRVRPTTTTTTNDVAQHGGHPAAPRKYVFWRHSNWSVVITISLSSLESPSINRRNRSVFSWFKNEKSLILNTTFCRVDLLNRFLTLFSNE